jgi:hypothetical protein
MSSNADRLDKHLVTRTAHVDRISMERFSLHSHETWHTGSPYNRVTQYVVSTGNEEYRYSDYRVRAVTTSCR